MEYQPPALSDDERVCQVPAAVRQMDNAAGQLVTGLPTPQEMMCYQTWAKNASESMMYRNVGKEAGIMMIMLAAREYNIGPAQALNGGLHIIEGKVELSARMMSALIRRAKHTLQIIESTDKKCTIRGRRHDTNEMHTVTFTIEEAQQAGLIKDRGGWKKNPIDMLYARAVSRLARQLFSDVIGIGYIEGEIRDSRANMEVLEASEELDDNKTSMLDDVLAMLNDGKQDGLAIAMNFVEAISKHYGWENAYTSCMLMEKPEVTLVKFKEWKIKQEAKNQKKDNVITLEDVSHL